MKKLLFFLPLLLIAQAATRPVILNWQPSTSTGVIGYNVYRSSIAGTTGLSPSNLGSYVKLNVLPVGGLSFIDPAATIGSNVFYVVTAIGAVCSSPPSGPCGESDFSLEVSIINVPFKATAPGNPRATVP